MKPWILVCWFLVGLISSVVPFSLSLFAAENSEMVWQTENPTKSLEDAKAQSKHVFLYWGAQWCPPCNAMKAEVFNRPEFQAAIKNMIPIMIDGDSADAQVWSDRFQVAGYPTMLILSPDGTERMRFYGYTPLATIQAAISATELNSESLAELLKKAKASQPLSETEWRQLTYSDWSKFNDSDGKPAVELALDLTKIIPAKLANEKSMLSAYVLLNATEAKPELQKKIREQFDALFASVTSNETTLLSAQILLVEGFSSLKLFTETEVSPEQKKQRVEAWSSALDRLTKGLGDSISARVSTTAAKVNLAKFQPVNAAQTIKFREELEVLRKELEKIKDQHLQTSLVPTLVDAYENLGDHQVALKILERTAAKSPTPWYFQSHAAYLIKEAGNMNGAVPYYERAMRSAKGSATRIQWTWTYLNAVDKSTLKDRNARIEATVADLFKLALKTPDGFNGRNLRSLNKAKDLVIQAAPQSKKLISVIAASRKQCDVIKDEQRLKACIDFFEPMVSLQLKDKKAG